MCVRFNARCFSSHAHELCSTQFFCVVQHPRRSLLSQHIFNMDMQYFAMLGCGRSLSLDCSKKKHDHRQHAKRESEQMYALNLFNLFLSVVCTSESFSLTPAYKHVVCSGVRILSFSLSLRESYGRRVFLVHIEHMYALSRWVVRMSEAFPLAFVV